MSSSNEFSVSLHFSLFPDPPPQLYPTRNQREEGERSAIEILAGYLSGCNSAA